MAFSIIASLVSQIIRSMIIFNAIADVIGGEGAPKIVSETSTNLLPQLWSNNTWVRQVGRLATLLVDSIYSNSVSNRLIVPVVIHTKFSTFPLKIHSIPSKFARASKGTCMRFVLLQAPKGPLV